MSEHITEIHVVNCWAFKDRRFSLRGKRHLVLLGPNGSGKTSILEGLASALLGGASLAWVNARQLVELHTKVVGSRRDVDETVRKHRHQLRVQEKIRSEAESNSQIAVPSFGTTDLVNWRRENDSVPVLMFTAPRAFQGEPVEGPRALDPQPNRARSVPSFVQYLVNRRTEQAYAREDGNADKADEIARWFSTFETQLSELLGEPVTLKFTRSPKFAFSLVHGDGRESPFEKLPAGYGAVLDMLATVIMRYDAAGKALDDRDALSILLIDEPEVHLHPRLQRSLLPTLAKLVPGAQIIAATHSPLVAASLEDAAVYSLEEGEAVSAYGLDPNAALMRIFDAKLQPDAVRELLDKAANEVEAQPEAARKTLRKAAEILGNDHDEVVRLTTLLSLLGAEDDAADS